MMILEARKHYFNTILGHEAVIEFLQKSSAYGKMPASFLFVGPAGVGKKSMAYAFAKFILSGGNEDSSNTSSNVSNKIEKGIHPDFHELNPKGGMNVIPIDDVRTVQDRISMSPNESENRVVVLPEAEALLPASANALLKSLEEPPSHVHFILVCENPEQLLPTINSRCMKVMFFQLPELEIEKWLIEKCGADDQQARLVARLAQGRPGEALALLSGNSFEIRSVLIENLDRVIKHGSSSIFRAATDIDKHKTPLPAILTVLIGWFRDMLLVRNEMAQGGKAENELNEALINFDQFPTLTRHAQAFTRDQVLLILQLLIDLQGDINRILYATLVYEHIFLSISRIVREDGLTFVKK